MRSTLRTDGSAARTALRLVLVVAVAAAVPLGVVAIAVWKCVVEAATFVALSVAARRVLPFPAARSAYRCMTVSIAAAPTATAGRLLVVIAAVDITTQLCVQLWRSLTSVA